MEDIGLPTKEFRHKEVSANTMNRFMCWFLIVGLFFGVLFYDFIFTHFGFSYVDEILALVFFLFTLLVYIHEPRRKIEPYWFWLFVIFSFYTIYSFGIHSNTKGAIIQDAVVELKPFLGFFCAYSVFTELTSTQKKMIKYSCFLSIFMLLMMTSDIEYFIGHTSRYATAATFIATLYLFVSDFRKRNLLVFLAMLFVAILSGKSKAFGFVTLFSILSVLYYKNIRFKFSFKGTLLFVGVLALIILVAWKKIDFYFIYGAQNISNNEIREAFARPAMYWGAWQILLDHVPFGSGLASFGTFFSAEYYSDVYYHYDLNIVYGLSEEMPDFIADAYYPSLAQFGFAGIIIFIYFWVYLIRKALSCRVANDRESSKLILLIVGIVCFFGIELIADTTLTHNRGLFMMVILGLACASIHDKKHYSLIEN